jgi:hypothetical protein
MPLIHDYVNEVLQDFAGALPKPSKAVRYQGEFWRAIPSRGPLWKQYRKLSPYLRRAGCQVNEQDSRHARVWIQAPPELLPPVLKTEQEQGD